MNFLVLRDGGWYPADLSSIKKGERFRIDIDTFTQRDNNPLGDDLYEASKDAYHDGSAWIVDIVKPNQPRWTSDYLGKISNAGITIQVKGSTQVTYKDVVG